MTDAEAKVRYAARVLAEHAAACRAAGVRMPVHLAALHALLASQRPGPPDLAPSTPDDHALAMSYEDAARRLAVSKRTVERVVASRALPTVDIGGCRRVTTADLELYVAGLRGAR